MGQVGRALIYGLAITLASPVQAAAPSAASTTAMQASPTSPVISTPTSPTATPSSPSPTATPPNPSPSPTATPSQPEPVDQSEALRRFRAAKELYNAGAYADAARGFEASYAAAASFEAAYNAGQAHDKAGADLASMTWFRLYLDSAPLSDKSYPLALQRVEELRARLGELRLQLDSPDEIREVRLNGELVALADFPRLVTPGRVELRLIGAEPGDIADIVAEVADGGTWTIHFPGFARTAEPVVTPPTRSIAPTAPKVLPPAARRGRPLVALFWTGTGLTAASAVALGVLGGLTLRAWNDYPACGQRLDCDVTREPFHRYKDATNAMIGVTVGLAVITLAFGLAALRDRRKARRAGRLRVTLAGVQLTF